MNPLAFFPFLNSLCLKAFLQIKQRTDGASVRGRGVAAGQSEDIKWATWKELHSSYSLVSSRHACSEFCSKCLNSIFTSLSSQPGLPGMCAGCWHCEAVPWCELLPRRARCGVEECFKHTLSNPFLFCSLVCSLQQSNPLISIPRIRARGADSSKLGKARLVTWALPERECFIRSVYKAYLNDFFFWDVKLLTHSHLSR